MSRPMRSWLSSLLLLITLSLAACGGGGGGSDSSGGSSGGSSSGGSASTGAGAAGGNTIVTNGTNVVPIVIDGALSSTNLPFVSITVCTPGSTAQCQVIDHVLLDTGSSGLRLLSSVLSSSLVLPQQTASNGNPLTECLQFVDGSAYGSVRAADVVLGGERLSSLPIQVIGDPQYGTVPATCTGRPENTVTDFGSNGVLGVSTALVDCGSACAVSAAVSNYYACPTPSTCTSTTLATSQQVPNPVARLSQDNNGVIVQLPSVPSGGAGTVQGSLILGIGTQANNALPASAQVLQLSSRGLLTTSYQGQNLTQSFFDTGSNFYFFADSSLTQCSGSFSGFYCPSSTQTLSATVTGTNGSTAPISFQIANAQSVVTANAGSKVFANIGAVASPGVSFDWGLPFFLGRNVYTAFENGTVAGTAGPWIAF